MFKNPFRKISTSPPLKTLILAECFLIIPFLSISNDPPEIVLNAAEEESVVVPVEDKSDTYISSIGDKPGEQSFQFSFAVRDEGSDDLPTLIREMVIRKGKYNQIEDWASNVSEASLFDGVEVISGRIHSDAIVFKPDPETFGSVANGSTRTYYLKIKLKKSLPSVIQKSIDGRRISFAVDARSFRTEDSTISSQFKNERTVVQSAKNKNVITVVATQLRFVQQPSNTLAAALISPAVSVEAVDIFGNRDLDDSSTINLQIESTTCGYLTGNSGMASEGFLGFDNLSPQVMENNIRLTANAGGLTPALSSAFNVTASGAVTSTLVHWNFDDRDFIADAGTSTNTTREISAVVDPGATIRFVAGAGGSSSSALSASRWQDGTGSKYWLISLETTGYQTLLMSFKQKSSAKGPRDFKLQYKVGNAGSWTDIPYGNITINSTTVWTTSSNLPLPPACNNQPLVFIRWLVNSTVSVDGSTISLGGTNHIEDILIKGTTPSTSANLYFRSKASGNFESPCTWQISSDTLSWRQAPTYPDFTARNIIISSGNHVKLNQNITFDEMLVEEDATLEIADTKFRINNGSGTDLLILGTFIDGASSVNGVSFSTNATWKLGPDATYIKTRNSSAASYRDAYEGGMSQIPASANWIIRYTGESDLSFTTINTYYPNLTFENYSSETHYEIKQQFSGSSSSVVIKGNLDIGGSGSNSLTVYNENTNSNPMLVSGSCVIRSNNIFSNKKSLISGTGLEVKGNLTVDGTLAVLSPASILKLSGSETQFLRGTGTITIENFSAANTSAGIVLEKDLEIPGNLNLLSSSLSIGNSHLSLAGKINYSAGKLSGGNNAVLSVKGSGTSVGNLIFEPNGQLLDSLIIDRNSTDAAAAVSLASDLWCNNLLLKNGILTTGENLFTFNNTGILLAPAPQAEDYKRSYICLCDSSGEVPVFVKPFAGQNGFRINNCGLNTFFPVGVDFNSPNRMWINNTGNPDHLTVALEKGDIGETGLPRVNRIWYVSQFDTSKKVSADMKLYFTKRDWTKGFPSFQDEIEPGFLWSDVRLVQKDYDDPNYIEAAVESDICNYINLVYDEKEVFGKLSIGISPDASGAKNGINSFNRFSVLNLNDIILPLRFGKLILSTSAKGVQLQFSAFDQQEVENFEVQRSSGFSPFIAIGQIKKNGEATGNYSFIDPDPLEGKNYYRIRAVEKDGKVHFSEIAEISSSHRPLFSLIPNPVTGRNLTVRLNGIPGGNCSFSIFDLTGRIVFNETIWLSGGTGEQQFYVPQLHPGIFFASIRGNNFFQVIKFIAN